MGDESHFQEMSGAAVLFLEPASDKIFSCNPAAARMLAQSVEDLLGLTLWEALGLPHNPDLNLAQAIHSGARTTLSPTLIHPPRAGELVVGGTLFSQQHEGRSAAVLLLFELASSAEHHFSTPLEASDVVAILGVDNVDQESHWRPGDIARRMIDIRFGLLQIVPAREDVGLPAGTTIANKIFQNFWV